jgi:hypothetical protein
LDALRLATSKLTPEFESIWFDQDTAFASDGRIGLLIDYNSGLECGTPAEPLIKVLNSAVGNVEMKDIKGLLHVSFGRSVIKLPTIELERKVWGFPEINSKSRGVPLSPILLAGLERCMIARPGGKQPGILHQGIIARPGKNGTTLFATDSTVMAIIDDVGELTDVDLILPYRFVDMVLRYAEPNDELYITPKYLAVVGTKVSIFAGVVSAKGLPDIAEPVKRFLDKASDPSDIPSEFFSVIERAKMLAGSSKDRFVRITGSAEEIRITADLNRGALDEVMKVTEPMSGSVEIDASNLIKLDGVGTSMRFVPRMGLIFEDEGFKLVVAGKT